GVWACRLRQTAVPEYDGGRLLRLETATALPQGRREARNDGVEELRDRDGLEVHGQAVVSRLRQEKQVLGQTLEPVDLDHRRLHRRPELAGVARVTQRQLELG